MLRYSFVVLFGILTGTILLHKLGNSLLDILESLFSLCFPFRESFLVFKRSIELLGMWILRKFMNNICFCLFDDLLKSVFYNSCEIILQEMTNDHIDEIYRIFQFWKKIMTSFRYIVIADIFLKTRFISNISWCNIKFIQELTLGV